MRPLPLIIVLLVLNHVAFNGSRIAVSLYAIHEGATTFAVGSLVALYALLPALSSVKAGRWIDRKGIHKPMLLGSAGIGIGTLVPFLVGQSWSLYITAVLVGLSFMLINVAAYHAVGELSAPEDRQANFSYVAIGFSTSGFVAPLLTGMTIESLGYRACFLILALFTVMPVLAMLARLLPESPHAEKPQTGERGHVFELLRDPELRRLFIAMAILTVGWDIYNFAIPVYGAQIGLRPAQIGIVMGSFAAATFAVRLAMPFIAHRVRPWGLLGAALLVSALAYVAIPFTQSVALLMALTFVLGLGLGAPQPTILTLLHQTAPQGRAAEALGLRTTLINGSQTVMPLVFGALGAALGVAPLFWGMAATMLLGASASRRHAGSSPPQV